MALKLKTTAIDKIQSETPQNQSKTILLVDDEKTNINSLSRILSQHYTVLTAFDGDMALELIKKEENPERIQVIITDQRMPCMSGVEFLRHTIPIIPRTIRIVLTGFTDIDNIIGSINEGQVYKFLTKPIEPFDLEVTVKRAFETYELAQKNIVLVDKLKELNASLEQKVIERTRELQKALEDLEEKNREIKKQRDILENVAKIDSLTNIPNRRSFDEMYDREWRRAVRTGMPLSVAMIDIDFFKQYNDAYGHGEGDECLKKVAQTLLRCCNRPGDYVARYGGEEFVAILSDVDETEAFEVVRKMKEGVQALNKLHCASEVSENLTISVGLASMSPTQDDRDPHVLVEKADQLLYKAKAQGRNQIIT